MDTNNFLLQSNEMLISCALGSLTSIIVASLEALHSQSMLHFRTHGDL
jgi:hypothetical protein